MPKGMSQVRRKQSSFKHANFVRLSFLTDRKSQVVKEVDGIKKKRDERRVKHAEIRQKKKEVCDKKITTCYLYRNIEHNYCYL